MENVQEVQQENILLKKQLLNHDRELLEENARLKEMFAASDEAREELEKAFDHLKEEHELLKTDMSNVQNCGKEIVIDEEKISQLQNMVDEKNMKIQSLEQEIEDLRYVFLFLNSFLAKNFSSYWE